MGLTVVGLVAAAAHDFWPESPRFAVDEPNRIFEDVKVGDTIKYSYRVRNLTNAPMRVVGAEFT